MRIAIEDGYVKIGNLRIRKLITPKWEWGQYRKFKDGTWQIALGRILIFTTKEML